MPNLYIEGYNIGIVGFDHLGLKYIHLIYRLLYEKRLADNFTDSFGNYRNHNYDVYINAPLIGFLYGRKGIKNSDGNVSFQNIFPEQMINASDQLKFILRLILLLDKEYEPDEAKRIDKAFRYFGTEEDLALFDQYVLGGVEVLYEKLIEGANGPDEYIERLYDFVEEFNDRFNSGISNEDIVNLSRSIEKK